MESWGYSPCVLPQPEDYELDSRSAAICDPYLLHTWLQSRLEHVWLQSRPCWSDPDMISEEVLPDLKFSNHCLHLDPKTHASMMTCRVRCHVL